MTTAEAAMPLGQPVHGATFRQAVTRFYAKYATFSGRASRSEFWWVALFFALLYALVWVVAGLAHLAVHDPAGGQVVFAVFAAISAVIAIGSIVPAIAIQVRRLHDADLSGYWWFLHLIPSIGSLIVLILNLLPSKPEGARFDA
ncbi:DUF805 domain-containing protein [Pseudolysinimonas sp.]|uniref:DUF805 domain-containing protein n=1 Tax=Pseudolysinimonas sp. TaxID=2680009 RepID=UPI003F7FB604